MDARIAARPANRAVGIWLLACCAMIAAMGLIGVAFLVPFVWFLATGRIARALRVPLASLFVLGGLQGALGWWMVASGLRDVPWVSPYRLTAHLGLAVAIYAAALWLALSLLR